MKTLVHFGFLAAFLATGALQAAGDQLEIPLAKGAFSAAWITDTQYYTEPHGDIGTFLKMTDWLKRHQDERNLQFLVHTGDITDNNQPTEWSRAETCMEVLNDVVPYFMAIGNHDMGKKGKAADRDLSLFNEHFGAGDNPLTAAAICALYEPGHMENACYFYDNGKWSLLILSLEFATRPAVVEWADHIVSAYPDRKVILITHDFIDFDSSLTTADGMSLRSNSDPVDGHAASYPIAKVEKIASAEDIWQNLIDKHSNFIMTLNGHFSANRPPVNGVPASRYASSYRIDKTSKGNYVHQLLFNSQFLKEPPAPGGHGWLRLMEFQPDGETIVFRTFSPFFAMDGDDATAPLMEDEWEQFTINVKNGERAINK